MAKFFLGQRVRIVRAAHIENVGKCGRITKLFVMRRRSAAMVDMTGPGDWSYTDDLEPILPSGHTASTESFQELMDRLNTQRVEKVEEVGA